MFGLAAQNSKVQPRLAVRFHDPDALRSFAKNNNIDDTSIYSRWRLTGLPAQCGAADVFQLLEARKWEIHEILYVGEHHAVFLASAVGSLSTMHFNAEDFSIIWGAPVRKGSRSGVAIIAKESSVWAIQKVDMANTVCFSHEKQGRLVVAQIFYGTGERSILIYTIYGHAGKHVAEKQRI